MIYEIVAIGILLLLLMFFNAAETSLTGASQPLMHQLEAEGSRAAARVNKLRARKDRMLGAILLGTTLTQIVASGLAQVTAKAHAFDRPATLALAEHWKALGTNVFNLGGLIGTLLTIPAAKLMGRRKMFAIYYFLSGVAILATFGLDLPPLTRLHMYFFIGVTVFGVFGSFTYYLPELFPTRLRGTGAGFCYNAGRVVAAGGPFLVGAIASRGVDSLASAMRVLFWIGVVPLVGVILSRWAIETKDQQLA